MNDVWWGKMGKGVSMCVSSDVRGSTAWPEKGEGKRGKEAGRSPTCHV